MPPAGINKQILTPGPPSVPSLLSLFLSALFLFLPNLVYGKKSPGNALTFLVELAPLKRNEKEEFGLRVVHPYSTDLRSLQQSMYSLAYQTRNFTWSRKKHVFSPALIRKLSPLIKNEFAQAEATEKINFKIRDISGRTLIEGDTFLTQDGLNWRITSLAGNKRRVDEFNLFGGSWKLASLKGQNYKKKNFLFLFKKNITNWIVFHQKKTTAKLKLKSLPAGLKPQVQKKLKFLKELKKEGLIDDKDYKTKKAEILEGL